MGVPRFLAHDIITFDTYRPWKDSGHLRELYHSRGMSQREMADSMGCRRQTVAKWMDRYDISTRSPGAHQTPAELRDESWVRRQHHDLGKPVPEIADLVGCSENAVRNALSRHGIEHRTRYTVDDIAQKMLNDKATLRYLHDEKELSQAQIARRLGVHQMTVSRYLREHGIETRPFEARSGQHNPRWLPQEEMAPTSEYGSERWRQIREQCLEKYDSKCKRCGITDEKHYYKHEFGLDIHHIKPVSEFDSRDEADSIDNLVPLCRGCHEAVEGIPIDVRV